MYTVHQHRPRLRRERDRQGLISAWPGDIILELPCSQNGRAVEKQYLLKRHTHDVEPVGVLLLGPVAYLLKHATGLKASCVCFLCRDLGD